MGHGKKEQVLMAMVVATVAEGLCVPKYGPGRYLVNISVPDEKKAVRPLVVNVPSLKRFEASPRQGLRNGGVIGFHGWHSNPWYYDVLSNATNMTEHYEMVLALPFGTAPRETYYCCPTGVSVEECMDGSYLADKLSDACGWKNSDGTDQDRREFRDVDDVAYSRAIVDFMVKDLCVDADKIFAMGLSDGGGMAARLACDLADKLAGVATMSGSLGLEECQPAKPIAMVSFCGTLDAACNLTSYSTYDLWRRRNQCARDYHLTYQSATTACRSARNCADRAITEQCLIAGLGDDIPGHDRNAPIVPNTTNVLQAPSNLDSVKYAFDRWSALFPSDQWPHTPVFVFPPGFFEKSHRAAAAEE